MYRTGSGKRGVLVLCSYFLPVLQSPGTVNLAFYLGRHTWSGASFADDKDRTILLSFAIDANSLSTVITGMTQVMRTPASSPRARS